MYQLEEIGIQEDATLQLLEMQHAIDLRVL